MKKTVVIEVSGGVVTEIKSNVRGLRTIVLEHDDADDCEFDPKNDICFHNADFDPKLKSLKAFKRLYGKVICSICHEKCRVRIAHRHQGQWIGDECCWTEQLRASE